MKKVLSVVLVLAALVVGSAFAADSATQDVSVTVEALNDITVTGAPSLTLSTLNAGGTAFEPAVDSTSSTYSVFTNGTDMKITAALGAALPTGVTLKLNMTAPASATSTGDVALSATAQDMVTAITEVSAQGLAMTYTLMADPNAGAVATTSSTVTFTITSSGL